MLDEKEIKIALSYLDKGAEFMFIPSSLLCELVSRGDCETDNINTQLKLYILEKKAIRLDESIVKKYCQGTLDSKNRWILDRGDIKIVPMQFELKNNRGESNAKR